MAISAHAWAIAGYSGMFGIGLAFTAGCTIFQGVSRRLIASRPLEALGSVDPASVAAE
jgi:hypothetical protein